MKIDTSNRNRIKTLRVFDWADLNVWSISVSSRLHYVMRTQGNMFVGLEGQFNRSFVVQFQTFMVNGGLNEHNN